MCVCVCVCVCVCIGDNQEYMERFIEINRECGLNNCVLSIEGKATFYSIFSKYVL